MKAINLEKLLPEDVPQGERILWHGRPQWTCLFRRAYRGDVVAGYFAVLTAWNVFDAVVESGPGAAALSGARTLEIGLGALVLLALLAWASARTALFIITSRRVVMKIGVALQVFYNLPFSQIKAARLRVEGDGSGDVTLTLSPGKRIGYLHLWPFARPFRFAHPEPTLRGLADPRHVGDILGRALIAAAAERGDMFVTGEDEDAVVSVSSPKTSMPAGNTVAA
ncbi:MAG TPA: photosynthetic complex putative assembly protein PuhB [Methylocystis sp.]